MVIQHFYYFGHKGNTLDVSDELKNCKTMPLIWFNAGLYGLISATRVANMIDVIELRIKASKLNRSCPAKFYWDECIPLDPKVAKILLGVTK